MLYRVHVTVQNDNPKLPGNVVFIKPNLFLKQRFPKSKCLGICCSYINRIQYSWYFSAI